MSSFTACRTTSGKPNSNGESARGADGSPLPPARRALFTNGQTAPFERARAAAQCSCAANQRSASRAAIHPVPAAVIA